MSAVFLCPGFDSFAIRFRPSSLTKLMLSKLGAQIAFNGGFVGEFALSA